MVVLSKEEIRRLIIEKGLVRDYIDLETQLQPNGFDCTLRKVSKIVGDGWIDFDNSERRIPETMEIEFEKDWIFLEKGCYRVTLNEIISIPKNITAIGKPRSSLVRSGATVLTAVWDAGYTGRSEVGLVVYNERGIWLKKNARIVQLIFLKLSEETEGYAGTYNFENILV